MPKIQQMINQKENTYKRQPADEISDIKSKMLHIKQTNR